MPKKVRNNFYFFMEEKRQEFSRKGIRYTMKQMSAVASPLWDKLKPEERAKYDAMAKEHKEQNKHVDCFSGKLASDGTKIANNMEELQAIDREKARIKLEIRTLLRNNEVDSEAFKENVVGMRFCVMIFNVACKIEERDDWFIPIEIGLVQYSVEYGIMNTYHKVIDFGSPPTGYFGACKAQSDNYHKLFLAKVPKERNYRKIWSEIMSFLCTDEDEILPIFTAHEDYEVSQTSGCLNWLADQIGADFSQIRVWSLAILLQELRTGLGIEFPSENLAIAALQFNSYDYSPGINCDFHDQEDSLYCALGKAYRQCYLLSEQVCSGFGVNITNKHIPYRNSITKEFCVFEPKQKPEPSVPRSIRVGNHANVEQRVHVRNKLNTLDDFEDDDEDEADPPQPTYSRGAAIGRGLPVNLPNLAYTQLNDEFANMGIGRGRARPK